jgi:integrase
MGTVFEQNGKWYINFVCKGKRKKRMVGTSKRKAGQALRRIEADIVNDKFNLAETRKMTFRELAEYWLENYSKIENAPSQYEKNRERIRNHLLPFFRETWIADITPRTIDEYKNSRHGKIKPSTINRTLAILRKMFNDAIRWGFMRTSPMTMVKQLKENQEGYDYYGESEVREFLKNCQEDFYEIACCAVYTGMRAGEIVALKWRDVDLERRIIRVERGANGTTKSRKIRYIPVNSRLLAVLKARKELNDGELVFPNDGGEMRQIGFRTEMKRAAERAGLRKIRFHDLRHTFASNFVIKGGNLLSLQKILGHSTINMTIRYAHLAPDFMANEIEVLDFEGEPSLDRPYRGGYA